MDKHTTERLSDILNKIGRSGKLQEYVDALDEEAVFNSFHEYFASLPEVNKLSRAELIRAADIDRSYGYQILKGTREPGRDKVILLCIAAGLKLHETQRALRAAGYDTLYPRKRRDAVIIFAVNESLCVRDTQELLEQFSEEILE